jgi:hypothetical protein
MGSVSTTTRPVTQDATPATAKPAAVHRSGVLSAAVFLQHVKVKGGRNIVVPSISLRRSYQDAAGDWQQTTALRRQDLLTAAFLLTKCYDTLGDLDRRVADDAERDGE